MPVIDLGSVVGPQGPQGATGATGAQGIQGNPGPNQVTDQTSTNLNGVLFGNQSRVTVKPVDSDPTADSTNLVSSGGTDKAIKGRVPVYGLGKNLLRNWYFVGGGTGRGVFPVNQRGQSSYSGNIYSISGFHNDTASKLDLIQSGIQLGYTSGTITDIYQYVDGPSQLLGKKLTLSVLDSNGFHTASGTMPSSAPGSLTNVVNINDGDIFRVRISSAGNIQFVWISGTAYSASTKRTVYAVKLELGTEQTLCHNEGTDANPVWVLNEVPDYEYELYRCMTSTADSSDTYANKSLVTSDEIGIVINGNKSASGASIGQYVVLQHSTISGKPNGIYKAAKTIPANTEIDGTYLTAVSAGGLNDLKSKADSSGYITVATGMKYSIAGDVVTVYLDDVSPTTTLTAIGSLPAEARPSINMRFSGVCDAYGRKSMTVRVNSDGVVAIQADGSYTSGYVVCTFVR